MGGNANLVLKVYLEKKQNHKLTASPRLCIPFKVVQAKRDTSRCQQACLGSVRCNLTGCRNLGLAWDSQCLPELADSVEQLRGACERFCSTQTTSSVCPMPSDFILGYKPSSAGPISSR